MAKYSGAYKSEKRKKELSRQKKQEEKKQKRFKKDADIVEKEEAEPLKEGEGSN